MNKQQREERLQKIIEMRASGMTMIEIGSAFDLTSQAIGYICRQAGVEKPPKKPKIKKPRPSRKGIGLKKDRLQQIAEMRVSGMPLHSIGEAFGISSERVRQICAKHGIDKPESESKKRLAAQRERAQKHRDSVLEFKQKIYDLREQGLSYNEIKEELGTDIDRQGLIQRMVHFIPQEKKEQRRQRMEERDRKIIEMRLGGATQEEVAASLGISAVRVHQICKRNGIEAVAASRAKSRALCNQMLAAREQGFSYEQIRELFGLDCGIARLRNRLCEFKRRQEKRIQGGTACAQLKSR